MEPQPDIFQNSRNNSDSPRITGIVQNIRAGKKSAHGIEDLDDDAAVNDPAQKIGKIRNTLHKFFIGLTFEFVQEQCEDNIQGKTDDEADQVDSYRIPQNPPNFRIAEKGAEMFEQIQLPASFLAQGASKKVNAL